MLYHTLYTQQGFNIQHQISRILDMEPNSASKEDASTIRAVESGFRIDEDLSHPQGDVLAKLL